MKYGYNGISQFSSVRNTDASSTLDKLPQSSIPKQFYFNG
ncbi:hypothetical protein [Streptococcus sp. SM3]|nr:hypothetical protein [Streptococcus sp. SM3]